MRYPKFNNKIGLIAPSFGCTFEPYKSRLDSAIKNLSNYNLVVYPNCYKSELPYRSNTAHSCANEFITSYTNDELLISVGGGEYMVEILDHINFEELSKLEPKWFMGYSDNTNLTFLLPILCDVASIYGPNAPDLGIETHKSFTDAFNILNNNLELTSYDTYESNSKLRDNSLS